MPNIAVPLSDREVAAVDDMASFHEMTQAQVIKQAIRLLQMVDSRARGGDRMAFVDNNGTLIKEEIPGVGPL